MFLALTRCLKFLKEPANTLEYTNVITLRSNHRHVSTTLQGDEFSCELFTVQTVSPLTNPDHNSPHVSSVYAIPQNHTTHNVLTSNISY